MGTLKHYHVLVGGLEHVLFFHILGISSSQLTKYHFSEGLVYHQPVLVFVYCKRLGPFMSFLLLWGGFMDVYSLGFTTLNYKWECSRRCEINLWGFLSTNHGELYFSIYWELYLPN